MVQAKGLSCDYCGAPLAVPASGNVVQCTYCERQLVVEGHQARRTAAIPAASVTDSLLRGYTGQDRGRGRRYGVAEMRSRDWRCERYGLWPASGRASSQYGSMWGANAIVGPPRVYPRCGDIRGAWAPGTRESHTEWIEALYAPGAPPARAIRVFETCMPGATYAVALRHGSGEEELIWQRPAALTGNEAQVLEIELSPPRTVGMVRAYVSNTLGNSWSEIDTIGLVAAAPLPLHLRQAPRRSGCAVWVLAAVVLAATGAGGLVFAIRAGGRSTVGGDRAYAGGGTAVPNVPLQGAASPLDPVLREPTRKVAGTVVRWEAPSPGALKALRPVWASAVIGFSSCYGDASWSGEQALGAPDVYPQHGDVAQAWATRERDQGWEWIAVRFPKPVATRAILLVETFNPGALARVDDLTDQQRPVELWKGETPGSTQSRVVRLELAEPRDMSAIRVVLDTHRQAGWNEIDAIGLVPR